MRKGLSITSVIGLCFAALFASASVAAERNISSEQAGTGFDTAVDTNGDGLPLSLTFVEGKGTFGHSNVVITAEFEPSDGNDCKGELEDYFDLVYSAAVSTFPDQSQLYAIAYDGWVCVSEVTGTYYGEVYGLYIGGTGRFEEATGTFMTPFRGMYLDPAIGFRSYQATVTGSVEVPHGPRR